MTKNILSDAGRNINLRMISIEHLLKTLHNEFEKHSYGEHPAELYDPITYIMSLNGKRFRPLLTLLTTSIFRDDWGDGFEARHGSRSFP